MRHNDYSFIRCDCKEHGLVIKRNHFEGSKILCLSIWKWGFCGDYRPSLIDRLKEAWEVIRWGECYGDQVLLDNTTLTELYNLLDEVKKEWEEQSKELED